MLDMARAQQRGSSATTVWMLIFSGLWLASTVWLVILYTGQEELRLRTEQAESKKNRAVSRTEERSIAAFNEAREGGPTLAGLLEADRVSTAILATGGDPSTADDPAGVRAKRDALLTRIVADGIVSSPKTYQPERNISLLEALDALYGDYTAQHQLLEGTEEEARDLERKHETAITLNATQKDYFARKTEEMVADFGEIQADRDRAGKEAADAVAALEQSFDDLRDDVEADLASERKKLAGALQRNRELEQRLSDLQFKCGDILITPELLSTARQADGEIVSAIPGDPVVHINLGERDGLILGLPFTVYSADLGIPPDGRGKALVEVVSIAGPSAECRIVKVFGNQVILEGDLVANPVFDRSRPLTYVVLGRFDLDRDGVADRNGAQKIAAIIDDSGGRTTTDLTALTDFLVLGAAPRRAKPAGEVSPDEAFENDQVRRRYQHYRDTLGAANEMHVPILPQDVFLNFLSRRGSRARR